MMNDILSLPAPVRADVTDRPADILRFAREGLQTGSVALATLTEIRGGAARDLGAHLAVRPDGRFCGYVSGGCVEAAVATEALQALALGQDRCVRFGEGSPFFDIVLPCGGGITVAIHILRQAQMLDHVLDALNRRQPAGLRYDPGQQVLSKIAPPARASWGEAGFSTLYQPQTRLIISGSGAEAQMLAQFARISGWEVGEPASLKTGDQDAFTAIALLHHDIDAEHTTLQAALSSKAFYIGALGSARTHQRRTARLQAEGADATDIARIRAPIGMFGPTRDATSLALSVAADIAAARLSALGSGLPKS